MNRRATLVLAAVLVAAPLSVAVGPVSAANATDGLVVTDVRTTPTAPAPGDTVTTSVLVRNPEGSANAVRIDRVEVVAADGPREYATERDLSVIPPGSEVRVPLHYSFDEAGEHHLEVRVDGRLQGEAVPGADIEAAAPAYVRVLDTATRAPNVRTERVSLVPGADKRVNATVGNTLPTDIESAQLTVSGPSLATTERRAVPAVAAGNRTTVGVDLRPTRTGPVNATVTLTYRTENGVERTTTTRRFVSVAPSVDVRANARRRVENGTTFVDYRLKNLGNVPLRDVVLRDRSDPVDISRAVDGPVRPGESRSVELRVDEGNLTTSTSVPVVAAYTAAGESRTTRSSVDVVADAGTMRLTGVRIERQGGRLHLSGSTSNVGLSTASAVLVSVVDTGVVSPAQPNPDYFVGEVAASDFVTFDLYARTHGNATSVPVRIEYVTNGRRERRVAEIPLRSAGESTHETAANDGRRESTGGGPGPLVFGGGVVAVVAAIVVYGWRRRDVGD